MIINAVDDANDLFEVKNPISQETMEELNKLDLLSLPTIENPATRTMGQSINQ